MEADWASCLYREECGSLDRREQISDMDAVRCFMSAQGHMVGFYGYFGFVLGAKPIREYFVEVRG